MRLLLILFFISSFAISNTCAAAAFAIRGGSWMLPRHQARVCVPTISYSYFFRNSMVTCPSQNGLHSEACLSTNKEQEEVLREATDRILSGQEKSVAILPYGEGKAHYKALPNTVLPPHSMIIPGSFNPPHSGHVQLAKAGLDATDCEVAWFELSITNADKPSLQQDIIMNRVLGFLKLNNMPDHWGIILSNAPLFVQKVDLLHPLQVSQSFSSGDPPPLHFVIGTDTLVRIIDPKYYDNSKEKMLQALYDMQCHFVVGGRLEQKTKGGEPEFISAEREVQSLPKDLQGKFTPLKDFRVDISSTELRRRQKQTADGGEQR